MKNLIVFVIVLLLTGCTNEMVNENLDSELLKSAQKVDKKLKMINIIGGFYYETATNECITGSEQQGIIFGEGNSTLLGKFKVYERYCVDENGMPIMFVEGYFTAANGDKINYVITNHWIDEQTGIEHSDHNIIGGTGRFENAEGEFVNSVNTDWSKLTFTGEATGTISY